MACRRPTRARWGKASIEIELLDEDESDCTETVVSRLDLDYVSGEEMTAPQLLLCLSGGQFPVRSFLCMEFVMPWPVCS